ncbi:MAG: CPBP family intramembrane glutamic endopeptidase [Patescibacteria group bacterium]
MKYSHLQAYRLTDALLVLGSFFISIIIVIFIYAWQIIFKINDISSVLHLSRDALSVLIQLFASGVVFTVVYFFIVKKYKLSLSDFGFKQISIAKIIGYVALGFLATFASWIAIAPFIIVFLPGIDLAESQEIFQKNMTITAQVLMIFYAVIIGPLVEEIIFRGVLLPCLTNKVNIYFGIIISTLIWSLLHFQLNVIIFTFIFGIILSYLYIASKSLWPSYLTHVIKNSMAVIAIYAFGLLN